MKNFFKTNALAFFLLCAACLPANAATFVEIYREDGLKIFLDTESAVHKGDRIEAWTKWVYSGKNLRKLRERFPKGFYTMNLDAYDLEGIRMQNLSLRVYDADGRRLEETSRDYARDRFEKTAPGSRNDRLHNAIMYHYYTYM